MSYFFACYVFFLLIANRKLHNPKFCVRQKAETQVIWMNSHVLEKSNQCRSERERKRGNPKWMCNPWTFLRNVWSSQPYPQVLVLIFKNHIYKKRYLIKSEWLGKGYHPMRYSPFGEWLLEFLKGSLKN
jgi:hypothetical protein